MPEPQQEAVDDFPVESFKEAARHLRRPFTAAAVKFKVQATWETGALIVSYIDARLAIERLNLIVPHLWSDQYTAVGGKQMWCHLTVDDITRHDVGEGEGKGLVSDALKRAGVKFGIGVSLYAVPQMMLNNDMLKRKQKGQKEEVTLNDKGEKHVRKLYATWLEQHGVKAFGKPLDHGDVEGAQGDHEADTAPVEPVSDVPSTIPPAEPIGDAEATEALLNADSAEVDRDMLRKATQHITGGMFDSFEDDAFVVKTLAQLMPDQLMRLGSWVEGKRKETVA
jgi:hypothetical protein